MRIAIPVWRKSVSTVFDYTDRLIMIDFEAGQIKGRSKIKFIESTIIKKTARLRELGVQVLVCGAISRPLENMITASGIKVIPFVRGTVDEVINAYFNDCLPDNRFVMPGCCSGELVGEKRGWRHGGGKRRGQK
jgi:predicted Fe-Mo cluster-binding NifX family protein